jgi:hypothetical protein
VVEVRLGPGAARPVVEVHGAGARDTCRRSGQWKALMPVIDRPTIRVFISRVPS